MVLQGLYSQGDLIWILFYMNVMEDDVATAPRYAHSGIVCKCVEQNSEQNLYTMHLPV